MRHATSMILLILSLLVEARPVSGQSTLPGVLRSIVYRNAPFLIAEIEENRPTRAIDHILPVDFDGDASGANNWGNAMGNPPVNGAPKVYYSIVETGYASDRGYYLVGYYIYHVMDDGQSVYEFATGGHEHDMEGVWLVIKKSPYYPYGLPVAALSEAHGALIPFPRNNPGIISTPQPYLGGPGWLESWLDTRYGAERPVFGIRSKTHGTYAAQDCSGATSPNRSGGIGMWKNSIQQSGSFVACIHGGTGGLIYRPMLEEALMPSSGLPVPETLPFYQNEGVWLYSLEELTQSALWQQRANGGALLTGVYRSMVGGLAGYDYFQSLVGGLDANPPWAWLGGSGQGVLGRYWYDWAADNTADRWFGRVDWPPARHGGLMGGAREEMIQRFPTLPELSEPERFNPYRADPPDYNTYVPYLEVSMTGPSNVNQGEAHTWMSNVTSGSPPFTYQWSGIQSGSGSSLTFQPWASGELYLDVWDAAGKHYAGAMYVIVNPMSECPGYEVCP